MQVALQQLAATQLPTGPPPDGYLHVPTVGPVVQQNNGGVTMQHEVPQAWPRLPHASAGVARTVRTTGVAHVVMIAVLRNLRRVSRRASSFADEAVSADSEPFDTAESSKVISSSVPALPG